MLVVDAVVDHRDFHALTARAGQAGERRRAEDGRPAIQVQVVGVARVDPLHGVGVEQLRQALVRKAHREAVDEHLIAPAHDRLGDLGADARDRPRLRGLETAQIRPREGRRQVQLRVPSEAGKPTRERGRGERLVVESDDDTDAVARARQAGDVGSGTHLLHRLGDDVTRRAVERAGGSPGDGDGSE
jgi:hypothetical protein